MIKPINWHKANMGVAVGKLKHRHNPLLMLKLNMIHHVLSGLSMNYYLRGNERLGGSKVDLPTLSKLYEHTRNEWKQANRSQRAGRGEMETNERREIATRVTSFLESKDMIVIPAEFAGYADRIFLILPATEGVAHQCAGYLERARICRWDDVDYIDEWDAPEAVHKAFMAAMPMGYTILSIEVKNIKVRNIPRVKTND